MGRKNVFPGNTPRLNICLNKIPNSPSQFSHINFFFLSIYFINYASIQQFHTSFLSFPPPPSLSHHPLLLCFCSERDLFPMSINKAWYIKNYSKTKLLTLYLGCETQSSMKNRVLRASKSIRDSFCSNC